MNADNFLEWLSNLWEQVRTLLRLPKPSSIQEQDPSEWEELQKLIDHEVRKSQAYEAAKTGEGPQPWDQDWFESNQDITDEIIELACKAGWHRLEHFKEVLRWAMASPQGQRAVASVQDRIGPDPTNPWLEPLVILANLYISANKASHKLLREQAKRLRYSEELTSDLGVCCP